MDPSRARTCAAREEMAKRWQRRRNRGPGGEGKWPACFWRPRNSHWQRMTRHERRKRAATAPWTNGEASALHVQRDQRDGNVPEKVSKGLRGIGGNCVAEIVDQIGPELIWTERMTGSLETVLMSCNRQEDNEASKNYFADLRKMEALWVTAKTFWQRRFYTFTVLALVWTEYTCSLYSKTWETSIGSRAT